MADVTLADLPAPDELSKAATPNAVSLADLPAPDKLEPKVEVPMSAGSRALDIGRGVARGVVEGITGVPETLSTWDTKLHNILFPHDKKPLPSEELSAALTSAVGKPRTMAGSGRNSVLLS